MVPGAWGCTTIWTQLYQFRVNTSVQKDADGPKELALDKVQLIEVSDDTLTCTNLFAKTVTITGAIKHVDLANSTVVIATA